MTKNEQDKRIALGEKRLTQLNQATQADLAGILQMLTTSRERLAHLKGRELCTLQEDASEEVLHLLMRSYEQAWQLQDLCGAVLRQIGERRLKGRVICCDDCPTPSADCLRVVYDPSSGIRTELPIHCALFCRVRKEESHGE